MRESLLVNFVYCHPVGHAIEALHYAHGYHRADPERRIAVALIESTATDLVELCPFVEELYPVPVDVFDGGADYDRVLSAIPSTWDFVVDDDRGHQPLQRVIFPGLAAYYDASGRHFTATRGSAGGEPPRYLAGEQFRLIIPEERRARAEHRLGARAPGIAMLPGGSSPRSHYPSVRSWTAIIDALVRRFPDAMFCLTGKLRADGRTTTTFDRAELDALRAALPRAIEVVDEPLVDQLAAMQACDVLVSPHTGFGMATLAVGDQRRVATAAMAASTWSGVVAMLGPKRRYCSA